MKEAKANSLPTDVYLSFVDSLFGNRGTLVTGVVVHVAWCLIVFSSTGSLFYIGLSLAFVANFAYRMIGVHQYDRADKQSLTREKIAATERAYVIGAATTATLLGIGSGYALVVLESSTIGFTCIAMTLGSMMSIVGRNYGSSYAVDTQILGCCVPIIVACLLTGEWHLVLMSLLLVPFGMTTRSMARGVREFLYENVIASRDMAAIAGRFDTALKTIAHGLIMLDESGRIDVINRQARDLLGIDAKLDVKDRELSDVLSQDAANIPSGVICDINRLTQGRLNRALLQIDDGRHLEFSVSRRSDGGVVLIFEDISARVAAEEKILHMVRFDALTGLPSRSYFGTLAVDMLDRSGDPLACLVVLDVDGFKHVNDLRGHVVGDRLLSAVAARIASLTGEACVAGRLIGDEFVLFLTGKDRKALEQRVGEMHARIQGGYQIGDLRLTVQVNGGCVIANASDFGMENWQIRADLALNDAKTRGNGSLTTFRPEMDARYVEEQKLRVDLRQAIEDASLYVVYQPMYRPDGSEIECFEALVRWKHPEKGLVGPNIFIPMAEEMGLVTYITRFVIERACRDCAAWQNEIPVSVNLSVHDLQNTEIVGFVTEVLSRYDLKPSRLHLEVTESCFMDDPVAVSAILNLFRKQGVTIAIDDFGTGFSSLSYLNSLPLDIVKIDRAFVRDIGSDQRRLKLLRGIVHLSRELELKIVIEGVETPEQLEIIIKHDIADLVQGYIFSPPVPADAIADLGPKESFPSRSSAGVRRRTKTPGTRTLSAAG
jgi:diguanylate cyclase (GGDEF)-like protein/PAS domain S-box-containing protein